MNVSSKYLFTLQLDLSPTLVGVFPDGRRIDVRYTGSVITDATQYAADWRDSYTALNVGDEGDGSTDDLEWSGLTGKVISGADSVLIRSDSVAAFAGRLTIRANDQFLLNTQLTGAVDLLVQPKLKDFKGGVVKDPPVTPPAGTVDTVLGISFEGATSKQGWAEEDLTQEAFFRYQLLLRGTLVAIGQVKFDDRGLPQSAKLDVAVIRAVARS